MEVLRMKEIAFYSIPHVNDGGEEPAQIGCRWNKNISIRRRRRTWSLTNICKQSGHSASGTTKERYRRTRMDEDRVDPVKQGR